MGFFDWFKSRPILSGSGQVSDEILEQAADRAVALTNPRLRLLDSCRETLRQPVEKSIVYLRNALLALPPPIPAAETAWAGEPALRAFFARPADLPSALGRSRKLRAVFDKNAGVEQAFIILGADYSERQARVPSLRDEGMQRDITRTAVDLSAPVISVCGRTDDEVRYTLGIKSFEYLVAQAMTEISEARDGQRELADSRKLIQARLRLLQQQDAGLGALFDSGPEGAERRQLENQLLENEQRMEENGSTRPALEYELECLRGVLENPENYLGFESKRLRLSTLNVVLDEDDADAASDVVFTLLNLCGVPRARHAFIIGYLGRADMPQVKLDIANAERFL